MKFSCNQKVAFLGQLLVVVLVGVFPTAGRTDQTWLYSDLEQFIDGSTIMAAGGGGSPSIANRLLKQYFSNSDSVQLTDISDIPADSIGTAATVGAIGSPAALFGLEDPLALPFNAYAAMDFIYQKYQAPITYLMPVEVGAVNGLYAFLLASKINSVGGGETVSVLNVDGGGRSVPTLPLLIYSYYPNAYDQQAFVASPVSQISPVSPIPSEWASLKAAGNSQDRIENTILAMLSGKDSPYAGAAGYGSFYAQATMVRQFPPVTGQMEVAHSVGATYQSSPKGADVADALSSAGRKSSIVFSGTVTDITQDTQGLDYGVVTIAGAGQYSGDTFTVQYENENICAYKKSYSDTDPFILGPDSIAYVPTDGTVFDNSDLYEAFQGGARPGVDIVAVLASPQITDIGGIMEAWEAVRAAIPNGKCNFAYSTPWIAESSISSR